MRFAWGLVLGLGVGCGTETGTAGTQSGACALAATASSCPECSDGPWTCVYGDVEVTEASCGGCQARAALYAELCDAGENDLADTIEGLTTCVQLTCEVRSDCACEPTCERSDAPTVTCPTACTAVSPPPADCGWTGDACGWM